MFVLVIINKLAQTFYKEKKVSTRQQHYAGTTRSDTISYHSSVAKGALALDL